MAQPKRKAAVVSEVREVKKASHIETVLFEVSTSSVQIKDQVDLLAERLQPVLPGDLVFAGIADPVDSSPEFSSIEKLLYKIRADQEHSAAVLKGLLEAIRV